MIPIALAVLASTAIGHEAHRHRSWAPGAARAALGVMIYALVPFVAFVNIAHLRLTAGVAGGLGLAYAALATVAVTAWLIGTRLLGLPRPAVGALICVVMLANTGYLGLPTVVALLGPGQLATGVAYDQLVSSPLLFTAGFGVGAGFGTRSGTGMRERLRAFFARNPPLLAVLAGLIAPASAAPEVLVHASHYVVLALLVLGFFAVGVNLGAEADAGIGPLPRPDAPVVCAIVLRMALTPLLLLVFSAAVVSVPRAYLLQAAMPSGINALIVGHLYGLDLRLIATTIGWCTAFALLVGVAVSLA